MQVLVVEDSAVYRKLIGDCLRGWDFGVTLAETDRRPGESWSSPTLPSSFYLTGCCPIWMALSFASASGRADRPVLMSM